MMLQAGFPDVLSHLRHHNKTYTTELGVTMLPSGDSNRDFDAKILAEEEGLRKHQHIGVMSACGRLHLSCLICMRLLFSSKCIYNRKVETKKTAHNRYVFVVRISGSLLLKSRKATWPVESLRP